ncbi:cytochrome P450 monooxygenase [Paecilomyces variotii No. 5]|uniref:Cytochrome P450 monooxygenase n=1 Tax=Byssochlamys spectabilis (strain No. 5 / NBRC 109023) TaxID=1356009 RepID=V5FZB7_BYSSN|nr:cytochrome P450 monooxygenase [Paecilomyces variotii No. 5]
MNIERTSFDVQETLFSFTLKRGALREMMLNYAVPHHLRLMIEAKQHVLTIITLSTAILLYLAWRNSKSKRALPLPPGPGFVFGIIPEKSTSKRFQKWNQKYGPIVSVRIGRQLFVILGTRQAAYDLLERRAQIYSSRPASLFLNKYLHKGLSSAFMPYSPQWRLHRRLHTSLLSAQASKVYRHLQDMQSKKLLHDFLSTDDFSETFYQYTSDVMFTLAYGKAQGRDDSDHQRLHQINEMATFILKTASFGTTLLDRFPFLDMFPHFIMKWRRMAENLHYQVKDAYIECCRSGLQSSCWNWSQAAQQRSEAKELPWEEICYSIGELYVAGIHTTKMVLENFIDASLLYPDMVEKAQAEIDFVVGTERLPSFDDMDQLPYVKAIISELLRWRTISTIGVPHTVIQEDNYMGYSIPAGATVVANQFGMNMDDTIFEDPTRFNPDRYIQNPELPVSVFGFGRRSCPGSRLAEGSLFIVISRLLWGYHISSLERTKNLENGSGLTSRKATFRARTPRHQQIIQKEWTDSEIDKSKVSSIIEQNLRSNNVSAR